MRRYFITYGDSLFESTKKRIVREAERTGLFDEIYAYGDSDVSSELRESKVFSVKRGGGLWSWKPDVIFMTLEKMCENDILVYCDAGCQIQYCKEWERYLTLLTKYDIIAQRIYQRTEKWSRRELIQEFENENGRKWPKLFQFHATTILIRKSEFVVRLIREWRDLMIKKPLLAMDVNTEEMKNQIKSFKENRHDQAIYSALIYKYLGVPTLSNRIYVMWEHIEDIDIFSNQAIRATRCRTNMLPTKRMRFRAILKRMVKDMLYKPFMIAPQQFLYEFLNNLDRRKNLINV